MKHPTLLAAFVWMIGAAGGVLVLAPGQARADAILTGSLLQTTYDNGNTVDLTAAGGIAWTQFATADSFGSGISGLTALDGSASGGYTNELYQTTWTNSILSPASGSSTSGLYLQGGSPYSGASFTVAASNTSEELLTLVVGGYGTGGDTLTATLGDLTYTAAFTASSPYFSNIYQIAFEGTNPGDTLAVSWLTANSTDNADFVAAAVSADTSVPEPMSLAVLGSGLVALAGVRRHRARAAA